MTASMPFLFVPILSWPTAPGGKLHTYAAGGTTPVVTYEADGTTPNTNPVVLDSNGTATVRLTAGVAYHFVLKDSTDTTTIWDADTYQSLYLVGSSTVNYPQTAVESAASVTPTDYSQRPGNALRYGADPTGVADSTTAITNALLCNAGSSIYAPAGTYKCTAPIDIVGGTLFYGDGMGVTTFNFNNPNGNQFIVVGDKATIRDLTITVSGVGTTTQVAAINVSSANWCQISRCEISGPSWAGVVLAVNASHNIVENCYIHSMQGSVSGGSDIVLSYGSGSAYYNIIRDNYLLGGLESGILILGNTGNNPQYNLVKGNHIGQHTAYGIADYRSGSSLDGFTQILGNYVENIQGTAYGGASGAGIYVLSSGGALVEGNTVKNCCVATSVRSLAPAGIAISTVGDPTGCAICNVIGNIVEGMTNWDGILIADVPSGCNVVGNTIRMPANTTGTAAINVLASSRVVVADNGIEITPTTGTTVAGINVGLVTPGTDQRNIVIKGNRIVGGNAGGITVSSAAAYNLLGLIIADNMLDSLGGTATALAISSITAIGGIITGNYMKVTTGLCISLSACTQYRLANNVLLTTGTYSFASSGTCTGTYFDKTNYVNGYLTNAGTGCICEQLGSAAVATGNSQVGDRVEQSIPVVGSPKGWRCTVAGSPGTYVSEGNL